MAMIFTSGNTRDALMSANKDYAGRSVWNQAFGNIGNSYGINANNLDTQYGQALNSAYMSSFQTKNQVYGSNLAQGYKQLALEEVDLAMQSAFDSYTSNYLAQKSELEESTAKAVGEYNTLLNTQAENQAAYANHAFNYLSYLYENNKDAFNSPALGRYAVYEDGEIVGVKSIDELQQGMFNTDGTLNEAGIDYINMVQNYGASGNMGQYTFTNYLMEKDPELLGWLSSADKHSYGKTNLNSFNDVAGTNSEEYKFDTANMTTEQKQAYYDRHNKINTEMINKYQNEEYDLDYQNTELWNLISYAKSLGIYDDVKDYIDKATNNMSTYKEKYDGNEEWAVSGAINDYQELYNAIAEKSGQSNSMFSDVQRTVDRAANEDLFETQYNELQSSGLTGDAYISKGRQILNNYGSIDVSKSEAPTVKGNLSEGQICVDYTTSNAGDESIDLLYDKSNKLDGAGFIELKNWSIDTGLGSSIKGMPDNYSLSIGRIGSKAVVKVDGKYYEIKNQHDTLDNYAFMLYLRTFKK
jgi:hypothetical protein